MCCYSNPCGSTSLSYVILANDIHDVSDLASVRKCGSSLDCPSLTEHTFRVISFVCK